MWRKSQSYIHDWFHRSRRKPLIIRGARQVGKTTLVQLAAESLGVSLITINLERPVSMPLAEDIQTRNPRQVLDAIQYQFNVTLHPDQHIIFFDEAQAAPEILDLCRYFYEEYPQFRVVVAGSLLDFELAEPAFSMPVGRTEFLYLGPMDFEEFLAARNQQKLLAFLKNYQLGDGMTKTVHGQFMEQLRTYIITGGMPEAVATFIETQSFAEVHRIQNNLVDAYRLDFHKYKGRADVDNLVKVFQALPGLIGKKLKYSNIDRQIRAQSLAQSLERLCLARVAYRVHHTSANGLPLAAEKNQRLFKTLFLDVGLVLSALGIAPSVLNQTDELNAINNGVLSKQFIGQQLLFLGEPYMEPTLFYWVREKASASAEIDYLIALGQDIIPIEVKTGRTGSLKSLHQFMLEKRKQHHSAVRFNSDLPSSVPVSVQLPNGHVSYTLHSLPLYMVSQLPRLIDL